MKIKLNKPIIGIEDGPALGLCNRRIHADVGDVLKVILNNGTYFICDSKYFPNTSIAVFLNQCEEVIRENASDKDDVLEDYDNTESKNNDLEDDPFYTAFHTDDDN
jgi:hypothetical protein